MWPNFDRKFLLDLGIFPTKLNENKVFMEQTSDHIKKNFKDKARLFSIVASIMASPINARKLGGQ